MKAIYTTTVSSTGGREGQSNSEDGRLSVNLSTPKELGGDGADGTNPEQLFGAGYSACYIGALKFVAAQQKLSLPADVKVTATVGIGENPKGVGFAIKVDMEVALNGMETDVAEKLIEDAHQVCPYSNATRGNIELVTKLVN
ncbi:organic hydroperoxide resistance protein [Curvivirga sp.]|uniref:organic hydroperoxide resistance protein n=1 Tax=Curvivirga sp. TaxID=2856848 RepID=UPI003B59C261